MTPTNRSSNQTLRVAERHVYHSTALPPGSGRPALPRAAYWRAVLMALGLAICLTLVLFVSHLVNYPHLRAGDVAPNTLYAPHNISFPNSTATDQLRQRASAMVTEKYRTDLRPQQTAARRAEATLRGAQNLASTTSGGITTHAVNTLVRDAGGAISPAVALRLLSLSPANLAAVHTLVTQALLVATGQPIYAAQLDNLRATPPFPATPTDSSVRSVAAQIYAAFLQPNQFPDSTLTEAARRQAAAQVRPVMTTYRRGQMIVQRGDVVDDTAMTALRAANMTESNVSWQLLIADLLICVVVSGFLHGYLVSARSPILLRPRQILMLDVLFLSALLAEAFLLQSSDLLPFIFPAATLSMLLTVLLNAELSMVAIAVWAVLAGWYLGGSFEDATYYLVTGLVGALLVRQVRRSSEFFVAGLGVTALGLATILAFRLLDQGYDWLGLSTYAAATAISGGLAAALTLGSLTLLGRLFGVTTGLHLLELSHPNHPLLRRLMVEAPGTFHHSMMISTLAERAAEQIGADPLLTRVAAYFHDIGKLHSPSSFAENQAGIANIHESIDPYESARIILAHVTEGLKLASQHHLPEVLEEAIAQHHGTNLVSFFYQQALAMHGDDQVKIEDFRYPGPRPQSREMAILMLADGVEAAVRASPGIDGDQIRAIIHRIAQDRLHNEQFDECDLTLRDLALIEESFGTTLQGLSHPRVQYPAPLPAVAGNG